MLDCVSVLDLWKKFTWHAILMRKTRADYIITPKLSSKASAPSVLIVGACGELHPDVRKHSAPSTSRSSSGGVRALLSSKYRITGKYSRPPQFDKPALRSIFSLNRLFPTPTNLTLLSTEVKVSSVRPLRLPRQRLNVHTWDLQK